MNSQEKGAKLTAKQKLIEDALADQFGLDYHKRND